MLTDTLNRELSGVGSEDILSESQLEEIQCTLEAQVSNTTRASYLVQRL